MSLLKTFHWWLATSSRRFRRRSKRSLAFQVQLLEPRALLSSVPAQFVDPHPQAGNRFGASLTVLTNGNLVVTSPNDDAGGGSTGNRTGAGAVYLFNSQTGAMIKTFTGSHAGDHVGSAGVTALTNGNFVIESPDWDGRKGAVTFGSATASVSGIINSINSLVGSTAGDQLGLTDVTALSNGNYVVASPIWSNETLTNAGAVTWGSGRAGVEGIISTRNSLIGTRTNDSLGSGGVTAVGLGNYTISSPKWNDNRGAVTFAGGSTGVHGTINSTNSLIGSTATDSVGGDGITLLTNGNYVVVSSTWNHLEIKSVGAVTWGSGSSGVTGVVSAANSLTGTVTSDSVGFGGVTALKNGNYVVLSRLWNNGAAGGVGAVTFGNGTIGQKGNVNGTNSLIGSSAFDFIGNGGVTALSNGNYVVASPAWKLNSATGVGAVTWANGTTGTIGLVSPLNSLVGSRPFDAVGRDGVTALTNGNYVVASSEWNNGTDGPRAGAVTWGSGATGIKGNVSAVNSLVGSFAGDGVGFKGVTALMNGNYVVDSPYWGAESVGAVTWGNGVTGVAGVVSADNSLVGDSQDDGVGMDGVTALMNGNYVVDSSGWGTDTLGAVTWGNGFTGITGVVSEDNSLVGSNQSDDVGNNGVIALSNGNYVINSSVWGSQSMGAVTWGNGTIGVTGTINALNSLIGAEPNDNVGSGEVTPLGNGNYVVNSPDWYGGLGGVTFGNGLTGVIGEVSDKNSVVGQFANSSSSPSINIAPDNSHAAVYAGLFGDGSGRVYGGSAVTGFTIDSKTGPAIGVADYLGVLINATGTLNFGATTLGTPAPQTITVNNSGNTPLIVGPVTASVGFAILHNFTANQHIAPGTSASFTIQLSGTAIGTLTGSALFSTNVATANPFLFNVKGTVTAPRGATSELIDPHPRTGNKFGSTVTVLTNGNVVITSPNDDAGAGSTADRTGAGAVYLYNGQTGALISTLTGSVAGDQLGSGGVTALRSGNFVVNSPAWNHSRGAVTFGSGTTGVKGTISAANSLVGLIPNDEVGIGKIEALGNGNYLVNSYNWNNGPLTNAGAVTWGNGKTGVTGTITAANSLIGSATASFVGYGGIAILSSGNYVVDSYKWNNGPVKNVGAATWGSGKTGVSGIVSASNSLVGTSANDQVGKTGVQYLSNGNYTVDSNEWNNFAGAVTWGNGLTGIIGHVNAANSLIGSKPQDNVGRGGVTRLTNGNYVVASPIWGAQFQGAVTWGSGLTGVSGTISASNSLVGTMRSDNVGSGGVTALTNGNYVVDSSNWNNGPIGIVGAVTWSNGTRGITGTINEANSLIGSLANDSVGLDGVTALSNGNYVIDSAIWGSQIVGAVTWGNGSRGVTGIVSTANSLLGSTASDRVGSGGVTALSNGNYVVDSPIWNSLAQGAVTWGNGTTGVRGIVSPVNSLVGTSFHDRVGDGGVTALSNGNYVVDSFDWNDENSNIVGAVTFGSGAVGVTGIVSAANSLVGSSADDQVGLGGVTSLSNGNYVVDSFQWRNDSLTNSGAVTWGDGTHGTKGRVSLANSLVGITANDTLGDGGITALSNGNYLVNSPNFSDNHGAVTFGSGTTAVSGSNSVEGDVANLDASTFYTPDAIHGAVYASFPGSGSGQVYRGFAATGFLNLTNNGPSIGVSGDSGVLANGAGVVNFGTATVGTPVTQTVTVTNYGNAPLIVQPVTVPAGFSIVTGTNFMANQPIAAGASVSFTIQLNGTSTGTSSGTVTFGTNDPTAKPFNFNVSGTLVAPLMVVKQGSAPLANGSGTVNLGSTLVGTPITQVITVTNSGNAPLLLTSASVPPGFSIVAGIDFTTGQLIAVGASAAFTLQLDATTAGALSGVVTIGNNDPSKSLFSFHVTGTVTAPLIVVQQDLTPLSNGIGSVGFGSTPVGTPATQLITVTNQGSAPLIVQPVTAPAGFSIVAGTNFSANQSIAAGTSASFTLQLDAATTGNPNGTVTISDSDTTASPFTFNITGIVTPRATAVPVLVVRQGSTTVANGSGTVIFNQVSGGTPVSQVFTLTNHGNAPLVVQPITAPGGFSIFNNFTVNQAIAAGTSLSFTIQLNGNATGSPTGAVTIVNNDPTASSFRFDAVANHRPTAITLSNSVVTSDLTSAVVAGEFTTTDADNRAVSHAAESFSYSVASPTFLNGSIAVPIFSIDDQGDLVVAAGAPVGVYSNVPITSTDRGGLSITPNFTIYVTGASTIGVPASVNVASGTSTDVIIASFPDPVIEIQNAPGSGNNSGGTGNQMLRAAIAAAQANNPNAKTLLINVISYQLGVGGDNSDFTIDANGHLQTAIVLNAAVKSRYHITIISTNVITGLSTIHPYTVTIVPVLKNTIVIKAATFTLPEGSPKGAMVASVPATDNGAQALTYAITNGNTNGAFAINSTTGRITVANSAALDLATNPMFVLTVRASDNGASGSAKITVHLTGITLSNSSIAENASIGTVIGQFKTTAAVTGNTFHYALASGKVNNAYFTIDASGHLKLNASLNAAVKNSYIVEVISTDQHGASISKRFTIAVLGPSNLELSNSTVARTAAIGTVVGQLKTTDAGTGNTFRYSLAPGVANNGAFTIDAEGHLKLNLRLTSTLRNNLTFVVVSTDQRGLKISKQFTISISGPRV